MTDGLRQRSVRQKSLKGGSRTSALANTTYSRYSAVPLRFPDAKQAKLMTSAYTRSFSCVEKVRSLPQWLSHFGWLRPFNVTRHKIWKLLLIHDYRLDVVKCQQLTHIGASRALSKFYICFIISCANLTLEINCNTVRRNWLRQT